MPSRDVLLGVAAFMDSTAAAGLLVKSADVKRIAEAYLSVCAEDLRKGPNELHGEDVRFALMKGLPARMAPRDAAAKSVPDVLDALYDHLELTEIVTQSFEIRHALAEDGPKFVALVKAGKNVEQRAPAKSKPFAHGASKLGRNDPCSCGSGKKYKKCHGKNE